MEIIFAILISVGFVLLCLAKVVKRLDPREMKKAAPRKVRSTVDSDEVNHFRDKFGTNEFWWKSKNLDPLREMNALRVPLVRDSLLVGKRLSIDPNKPLSGLKVLDIGSGGGLLSEPIAALGAQVTGVEPVAQCVAIAERHLREECPELKGNLNYICSTIESIVSKKTLSSFDGVVASEVLEHVDDVPLFLKSAHSLLKPGGPLIITTINQTLLAYIFAIFGTERVARLLPVGTHHYEKLVPIEGLRKQLSEIGFKVKAVRGQVFNPFSGKWSWIKYTNINYVMVAVK